MKKAIAIITLFLVISLSLSVSALVIKDTASWRFGAVTGMAILSKGIGAKGIESQKTIARPAPSIRPMMLRDILAINVTPYGVANLAIGVMQVSSQYNLGSYHRGTWYEQSNVDSQGPVWVEIDWQRPETNVKLVDEEKNERKIYLPASNENGNLSYPEIYWIAKDGSSYFARADHQRGWPDLTYQQALVSKHLARKAGATTPAVCTDSDGGLNYNVKGALIEGGAVYKDSTDFCQDDKTLFEYDCGYENGIVGSCHNGEGGCRHICPNGCKDGACISAVGKPCSVDATKCNLEWKAPICGKVVPSASGFEELCDVPSKDGGSAGFSFNQPGDCASVNLCPNGCKEGACLSGPAVTIQKANLGGINARYSFGEQVKAWLKVIDTNGNPVTPKQGVTAEITSVSPSGTVNAAKKMDYDYSKGYYLFVTPPIDASAENGHWTVFAVLYDSSGAKIFTSEKASFTVNTKGYSCDKLQDKSANYFTMCMGEGYDHACFNKYSGEFQGCTKSTYNDCTQMNINSAQNVLCPLKATAPNATMDCKDSDGGKNIFVAGTATKGYSGKGDYCGFSKSEKGTLYEAVCTNGEIASVEVVCPKITPYCRDGICTKDSSPVCTDTDGSNPQTQGTITVRRFAEPVKDTDYCENLQTLQPENPCSGELCGVREFSCGQYGEIVADVPCPNGCKEGACIIREGNNETLVGVPIVPVPPQTPVSVAEKVTCLFKSARGPKEINKCYSSKGQCSGTSSCTVEIAAPAGEPAGEKVTWSSSCKRPATAITTMDGSSETIVFVC